MKFTLLLIVFAFTIVGCAVQPSVLKDVEGSKPESLRLMQVFAIANQQTMHNTDAYNQLIREAFEFVSPSWNPDQERKAILAQLRTAGIIDADLDQGAVAIGRVYCCGGPYEFIYRLFAYVPAAIQLLKYDTVEVSIGNASQQSKAVAANLVTKLIHRYKQPPHNCQWVPNNPRQWNRVLYCDGLRESGWIYHEPLLSEYGHTWIQLPDAGKGQLENR